MIPLQHNEMTISTAILVRPLKRTRIKTYSKNMNVGKVSKLRVIPQ